MSVNGPNVSPEIPSTTSSRPSSPALGTEQAQKQQMDAVIDTGRSSFDSERSGASSPPIVNGLPANGPVAVNGRKHAEEVDSDPLLRLQQELDRTKEEKETLAAQYRNLLGRLTTMRTTLGNKLKQDAEELDRREQIVQQLTAQNDDLSTTVETLKQELIASHQDSEHASAELDAMRARAYQENAQENLRRERELRETQSELERCRLERDEWERMALQERVFVDEAKSAAETYKRDLDLEREAHGRDQAELGLEREKSTNLQSVLEDFQAAKEHELRQAVQDYESQLTQTTQSLAEYKHRALTAELQLEGTQTDTSRIQELEKDVKEKNSLIGKLRYEAVVNNEHLMEALRRLRRNSTDTNVDRRLVTNILLSFLTTPREDAKRFEMLGILATILSWTDPEREKAGLQRAHGVTPRSSSSFWSRSPSASPAKASAELEKTDETESFSRLWVEFLLTEAASGQAPPPPPQPPRSNTSAPGSPTPTQHPQFFSSTLTVPGSSDAPKKEPRRLSSSGFGSAAMASSPDLTLGPPPSRKGKERAPPT